MLATLSHRVRLFLSNGTDPLRDFEIHRRTILLNLIIVVGALFLATLGSLALLQQNFILALADFTMFLFVGWLFLRIRRSGQLVPWDVLGTGILGGFYVFLLANGGQHQTGFLWFYTYPLISIFILGQRRGVAVTLAALVPALAVFALSGRVPWIQPYPLDFALRYIPSVLAVMLFAWSMERVRLYIQRQMETQHRAMRDSHSELERTTTALRETSIRDGLTGLFNRRHLDEVVPIVFDQCRRHNSTLALLMIDIDNFKQYNDCYGHIQGDEALKHVARALEKIIRRNTDMIFRYGGEEFLILLTKTTRAASIDIARKISAAVIEQAVTHEQSEHDVLTVSIGVSISEDSRSTDYKAMIQLADDALYSAKDQGRNKVISSTL